MTTLDSSSPIESSMDENHSNAHRNHRRLQTLTKAKSAATTVTTANNQGSSLAAADGGLCGDQNVDGDDGAKFAEGEVDAEVWLRFTENFQQVQSVLDRNRLLIQLVNENHQSKIHDNLVKNVALIQEINGNISKIVSLYSDFSANFSSMFHQRNGEAKAKGDEGRGDAEKA